MGINVVSPLKPACPERPCIRLLFACGTVCHYNEAMSAREALQSSLNNLADVSDKSFNNFLLCDSASLRIGKRACPVHPDMQLQLGHLYYVLPIQTYQHRLAWSHISALVAMAMPSSSAMTPSSRLSSAAKTHVSSLSLSKISKQCAVLRTFTRISDAKFYLRFLLCRRILSKGKCKIDNTQAGSHGNCKGSSVHMALDTEGRRAEGAAELSSKCRGSTWKFNNICESHEANSKYVELLIERSNSWRPPLLTIQESLAV